ncbi:MAG: hypothetical protein WBN94_02185, partial [Methanothrix sp.]
MTEEEYAKLCKETEEEYAKQEGHEEVRKAYVDRPTSELLKEQLVADAQQDALQVEIDRISHLSDDQLAKEYDRQEMIKDAGSGDIPWFNKSKGVTK